MRTKLMEFKRQHGTKGSEPVYLNVDNICSVEPYQDDVTLITMIDDGIFYVMGSLTEVAMAIEDRFESIMSLRLTGG